MTSKRFINDIDIGQLIDTKGELSTIDYSDKVDFYELWEFLNKLNDENEQLKKQMQRLYNYFVDWHGDIMGANQFSEMWDDVKEDEDWED